MLNASPLVVTIGTSILSPAGSDLIRAFHKSPEVTVLTTSLFMLVSTLYEAFADGTLTTRVRGLPLVHWSGVLCQRTLEENILC